MRRKVITKQVKTHKLKCSMSQYVNYYWIGSFKFTFVSKCNIHLMFWYIIIYEKPKTNVWWVFINKKTVCPWILLFTSLMELVTACFMKIQDCLTGINSGGATIVASRDSSPSFCVMLIITIILCKILHIEPNKQSCTRIILYDSCTYS